MNKFRTSILARGLTTMGVAIAMLQGAIATAQTTDNATVDAVATLQQVTPPLSVIGVNSLILDTVNIPNGTVPGNQCSYDLRASASATMNVVELDSSGSTVDSTFPTPSNCESSGSPLAARFFVNCNAATPTTLSYTFTSPLSQSGAVFTDSNSTRMAALQQDSTGSPFSVSNSNTMVATCPDGSASSSTPGAMDILVGGRLILGELATEGSSVRVGTITLTATY